MDGDQPLSEILAGLRRRWPIVLGLPLLVGLGSAITRPPEATAYETRFAIAIAVPEHALLPGSDEGTAAKIGEALIDDLARVIPGDVFSEAVARRLPADVDVSAASIAGSLAADDRHRIADISVSGWLPPGAGTEGRRALEAELEAIARAVADELTEDAATWFSLLGTPDVSVRIIDSPGRPAPIGPSLRSRLELPLRVALAAAVALGLALALHLRDDRLYTTTQVMRSTGLALLVAIPRPPPIRRRT